ncbi:MAG: tRNA 2-thiouridine(34) synthase MnmA [Planctomycetota bacterium]
MSAGVGQAGGVGADASVDAAVGAAVGSIEPGRGRKVLVAMSGGVDSSVAAALLKRAGWEVVGAFMRLGSDDSIEAAEGYDNLFEGCATDPSQPKAGGGRHQGCCSVNDAADARLVAAHLGVPFYVINFKRDFGRVIEYFVDEYNAGRTPNPCVRCNDWLKFGRLHDYAASIGAEYVASGHYAQVGRDDAGAATLVRGRDGGKDQSYVLFGTTAAKLERMLLPIGGLEKRAVRGLAEALGLPVFDKPDSQEICFVPDRDYARLVERRTDGGFEEGEIVDTSGAVVGTHGGQQRFTIGQRRGLNLAMGYPIYVVDKDAATNRVVIGSKEDLAATGCVAGRVNWLDGEVSTAWRRCGVKVRYNGGEGTGAVCLADEPGDDGGLAIEVRFDGALEAVTPGQAVVCYEGDRVIGGAWIDRAVR